MMLQLQWQHLLRGQRKFLSESSMLIRKQNQPPGSSSLGAEQMMFGLTKTPSLRGSNSSLWKMHGYHVTTNDDFYRFGFSDVSPNIIFRKDKLTLREIMRTSSWFRRFLQGAWCFQRYERGGWLKISLLKIACECFPEQWVFPPNHPFLIGFSNINHPFWGPTPIFGNTHIFQLGCKGFCFCVCVAQQAAWLAELLISSLEVFGSPLCLKTLGSMVFLLAGSQT